MSSINLNIADRQLVAVLVRTDLHVCVVYIVR